MNWQEKHQIEELCSAFDAELVIEQVDMEELRPAFQAVVRYAPGCSFIIDNTPDVFKVTINGKTFGSFNAARIYLSVKYGKDTDGKSDYKE